MGEAVSAEVIQAVADTIAESRNALLIFERLADCFAAFRAIASAAGWVVA